MSGYAGRMWKVTEVSLCHPVAEVVSSTASQQLAAMSRRLTDLNGVLVSCVCVVWSGRVGSRRELWGMTQGVVRYVDGRLRANLVERWPPGQPVHAEIAQHDDDDN